MSLHWQFNSHLALDNQHILAERCVEHPNCHRELVTLFVHGRPKGPGKWFYFIDEPFDLNEYATEADMVAVLMNTSGASS